MLTVNPCSEPIVMIQPMAHIHRIWDSSVMPTPSNRSCERRSRNKPLRLELAEFSAITCVIKLPVFSDLGAAAHAEKPSLFR